MDLVREFRMFTRTRCVQVAVPERLGAVRSFARKSAPDARDAAWGGRFSVLAGTNLIDNLWTSSVSGNPKPVVYLDFSQR